jgi:hypothetical protein
MLANLTTKDLRRAIQIREKIEELEAELAALGSGSEAPSPRGRKPGKAPGSKAGRRPRKELIMPEGAPRKRRKMTSAALERIREGQRKRRARERGEAV